MSSLQEVDLYIQSFEGKTKEYLIHLRQLIREVIPDTTELINYNIPAFTLIEGGKREQQIMIAGYKKHIGLYPHPTVMEKFVVELSAYKRGKGSVQFPLEKPLPDDLIKRMITYRMGLINQ